jgi:hypothetical protein
MHDLSPIFLILFIFGIIAISRGRFGRHGWTPGYRRLEQEIADLRAERSAPPAQLRGPTLDQVQMLEDRVRVLARIVTDQNYGLAREIEALRDTPERQKLEQGSEI